MEITNFNWWIGAFYDYRTDNISSSIKAYQTRDELVNALHNWFKTYIHSHDLTVSTRLVPIKNVVIDQDTDKISVHVAGYRLEDFKTHQPLIKAMVQNVGLMPK